MVDRHWKIYQAEATWRFVARELAGFLSKPFSWETLEEVVRKATDFVAPGEPVASFSERPAAPR